VTTPLHVDVQLAVWCESIKRGCAFTCRITDGAVGRFYSGTGTTALEAVAWCLDDYVQRAVLGRPHTMSRGYDEQPGDTLRDIKPANMIRDGIAASASLAPSPTAVPQPTPAVLPPSPAGVRDAGGFGLPVDQAFRAREAAPAVLALEACVAAPRKAVRR
jgi:hypothetical protein